MLQLGERNSTRCDIAVESKYKFRRLGMMVKVICLGRELASC